MNARGVASWIENAEIRTYEGRRWLPLLLLASITAGALAGWEALSQASHHLAFFFGSPTGIEGVLRSWISAGTLWTEVAVTFEEAALGFALGVGVGVAVALGSVAVPSAGDVIEPLMSGLIALPTLALIPFFVEWFGIGLLSKIVFVAFLVALIVFINVVNGLRDLDQIYVKGALIAGASRMALVRDVYLPGIVLWLVAAFRIGVPLAFASAVISEYIGSTEGLGWLILRGYALDQVDQVFAGLFIVAVAVILLDIAVRRAERWAARWRS